MHIEPNMNYIEKLNRLNPKILKEFEIIKEYKNDSNKILLRGKYGLVEMYPPSLLKTKNITIRNALNKTEYFRNMLKDMGNPYDEYKVISEFKGVNEYILLEDEFGICKIKPAHIIKKKSKLGIKSAVDKKDYFLKIIKKINNAFYNQILDIEYYNSGKKIKIKTKYGWLMANKNSILRGVTPSVKLAVNQDDYIRNMALEAHPSGYDYSNLKYKGKMNIEHELYCEKHGLFVQSLVTHITVGCGCPKCNSSKLERQTHSFLKLNNVDFIQEYRFKNCKNIKPLPFDFYLPKQNMLIELDGEQHFKPVCFGGITRQEAEINFEKTKYNDSIKNEFCKKNGIRLIRISYQDTDTIASILKKYISLKE